MFPPITSDATRNEYKRIFNEEYQEYLDLKGQIEVVTNEVTALSQQMAAVKKGTEEAKVWQQTIFVSINGVNLAQNSTGMMIVKIVKVSLFQGGQLEEFLNFLCRF